MEALLATSKFLKQIYAYLQPKAALVHLTKNTLNLSYMKTFSKQLQTLLLAAFTLTALFGFSPANATDEPYLTKEFSLNGPGDLKVRTSGGSIKVEAHESSQVRVEMYLRKGNKNYAAGAAEAKELLEDYQINISQSGNSVSAIAEKENNDWFSFGNSPSISFKVYVPKNMATDLNTSGGSISLSGVNGSQKVKTSGGSLNLANIEGNMDARTSGGSISIDDYSGVLNAHTSGGSIKLDEASGDLTLHTSGGSIKLDKVQGSVDASTSGGSINAHVVSLNKHLKLHTSGGSVKAVIPAGLGLNLDLKGNKVNTKLQNFDGEVEKNRVRGSVNGGGILVSMSTSGGNVNLEYQ